LLHAGYPCPPYKLLILDEADSMTQVCVRVCVYVCVCVCACACAILDEADLDEVDSMPQVRMCISCRPNIPKALVPRSAFPLNLSHTHTNRYNIQTQTDNMLMDKTIALREYIHFAQFLRL